MSHAVAHDVGIDALDLPLRASVQTWNAQDIALHLPIFKQRVEAARVLAKGTLPSDPQKHPRWPTGAPNSQGGEFAPAGASGVSVSIIPVAARRTAKPPKRSAPKPPDQPPTADKPGVRFLEPGEFPDDVPLPPPRPGSWRGA